MSYTNKTKHLKLPQWELSDKPDMTDFNRAFSDIDDMTADIEDSFNRFQATLEHQKEETSTLVENAKFDLKADLQERVGTGIRSWVLRLRANSATPVKLTQADGQDMYPGYTYRVSARTIGTGNATWATAILGRLNAADGFIIFDEAYKFSSNNHPKFLIQDENPYITLWNHAQFYDIDVYIEQLPFPNAE